MKKSAHFQRISENEAKSIATQVSVGILSETKQALAKTQNELVKHIPQGNLEQVYAEVERTLRSRGIYAKFSRNNSTSQ